MVKVESSKKPSGRKKNVYLGDDDSVGSADEDGDEGKGKGKRAYLSLDSRR